MNYIARVTALLVCTAILSGPLTAFAGDGAQQQTASDSVRKVTNRVVPAYPSLARTMNVHGVVKIEAVVAPNGVVKGVEIKGGHPLLIQSAESAVRKWKWQPAQHESKEVIEVRFDADK